MAETKYINANPEVLKWARVTLAINKTKATDALKISSSHLAQLESGIKQPTLDELKSMSKLYKRTIASLLLYNPPAEKPLPQDCRTVNSSEMGKFDEKTILQMRKARALAQSYIDIHNELNISIPDFKIRASLIDEPEKLSLDFRKLFNVNEISSIDKHNTFLEACIEKIEDLGIAVFQLPLSQDNLRGFSLIDEDIPVIVLKSGEEPTKKVFTLFHEFGHILLREGGMCDVTLSRHDKKIEKWCNAFAAEFLLPLSILSKETILSEYDSLNIKEWKQKDLIEIGNKYHVGPLVVLRRLLTLGKTTNDYYFEKHQKWNKPFIAISKEHKGRERPKEIIKERGKNYVSLVFKAYDLNKINIKDVSDYLGLKLSYLQTTRQLLSA